MTTAELLAQVSIIIDDTVEPHLVPSEDILLALSNAQAEFAAQTLCLYSMTETAAATADEPLLQLPDNSIILKALISPSGDVVRAVSLYEIMYGSFALTDTDTAETQSSWRTATGEPRFAITDLQHGSVRLVPIPTADTTYTVEGYIAPPALSLSPEQNPVIPVPYHQDLLAGAVARIYGSQNVELYDAQSAAVWQERWRTALDKATQQLNGVIRVTGRDYPLPRTVTPRHMYQSPAQQR